MRSQSAAFRYFVTALSVLCGIGLAVWEFSQANGTLPRSPAGTSRQQTPEESRLIFDLCVTFYGCVYLTGRVLYRLLDSMAESEELRRWSRWHMVVLHLLGGFWLVTSAWDTFSKFGLLRPSTLVAAGLLVSTIIDVVAFYVHEDREKT